MADALKSRTPALRESVFVLHAISPGAGYMPLTLDLEPWLKLVEGRPCWIYPANNHWKQTEVTRAWAKLMWRRGAHGLYLFNWGHLLYGFDRHTPPQSETLGTVWFDELHPSYYQALREIGDPGLVAFQDATYDLESEDRGKLDGMQGDNNRYFRGIESIELPLELSVGTHTIQLPFAEDIAGAEARGHTPLITLRLRLMQYTVPDDFDVSLNGDLLDPATRTTRAIFIMDNDTWMEYPIDSRLFARSGNELTFTVRALNPQMEVAPSLNDLELVVRYQGA